MDFKVDQHGLKVDYLNATIMFNTRTNLIRVCSFSKKTNTHSYVDFTSMHQLSSFKSCIETLFFMARCLNDDSTFATICAKEAKCLNNRHYPLDLVFNILNKYQTISQEQALKISYKRHDITIKNKNRIKKRIAKQSPTGESSLQKPIYLIYRHHVVLPHPKLIVLRLQNILNKDNTVKNLFPMAIWQFGYKRDRNLKDALSVSGRQYEHLLLPFNNAGNYKCPFSNCRMCRQQPNSQPILKHKLRDYLCHHTGYTNKILCNLNCQSTWIIYGLICNDCGAMYIGSSETSAYQRIMNGHINTLLKTSELNIDQINKDKFSQSPLLKHAKIRCPIHNQNNSCNNNNSKSNPIPRKSFAHNFTAVIIERILDYLPTSNPFHIQYVAKARARLNLRERIQQANHNTIHTNGLNDTKDFNNNNTFRRNTPSSFLTHYKLFNYIFETPKYNEKTKQELDIDFEYYGLLHMYNHQMEKTPNILIDNIKRVEHKYKHNREKLDNNKYYMYNIKQHYHHIMALRVKMDNDLHNNQKYHYNYNYQQQRLNFENSMKNINSMDPTFDREFNFDNYPERLMNDDNNPQQPPAPPPIPHGTIPPTQSKTAEITISNNKVKQDVVFKNLRSRTVLKR